MNICIFARILTTHAIGGMQQHTKDLSEGLVNLGNRVVIITTSHPQKIQKEILNGVEIHYLENVISSVYTGAWWKKSKEKFIELHNKINFNIICSESTAGYSYIKYKLRKKFKIPFILIIHGSTIGEIKSLLSQKFAIRKVLNVLYYIYDYFTVSLFAFRFSDIIIAISRELKKTIMRAFFINKKRLIYKPIGVDGKKFYPISPDKQKINKNLLLIGRIREEKGFQKLLLILPEIIKEIKNVKLLIIGTGFYLNHLKKICRDLNLIDYVEFLGKIPNDKLVYYYNLSNIFICPSIGMEGLPYVILEAMACKTTIIAFNIGGIPTAIKHLSNGILIPLGDISSLKKSILFLLKNEKFSRQLAENARKDFMKYFDINYINLFFNNLFHKFYLLIINTHNKFNKISKKKQF